MDSPLAHHATSWTCKEPDCGVVIPVLDGFGDSIMRYHQMTHVVFRLSAACSALTDERISLTDQLSMVSQLHREQMEINGRLQKQLNILMSAHYHAADGMSVMTA